DPAPGRRPSILRQLLISIRQARAGLDEPRLVHPDRVALAPVRENLRRPQLARLGLVMRRVASHAEALGSQQDRALPLSAHRGGEARGRIAIAYAVAVAREPYGPVGPMTRAESARN